ncbi:type-F conjugative transfer system protein TrbI [Yokenella regensburgei]|uniref:type-F conjugative transfer system protein TrbI n=1 Tax=Yokenella regensburgei TaxID=158877 RepID=UPI001ED91E82|nr:type-F conjugative transfer system protein TrbI [Yokenella regensburgei]KAF1366744.1 conjugal transfer pilin signal peptidase TrbI [Yokenella regensburgei]
MGTLNSNDIRRGIVTPARRRLRLRGRSLMLAVALIAVNAGISALMVEWRTPDVVTFDMKGTIDRFMDQSSRKNLDEATSRALTERFTSNLNRSIEDWQASHRALILVTPAVVSGARDITRDVQQDVARKMQAGQ